MKDGKMAVLIGDVSGHGPSAALVVAVAKGLVVHLAEQFNPSTALTSMNQVFMTLLQKKKMMTAFFLVVDSASSTMVYANAGHTYPNLVKKGELTVIEQASFPLGVRIRPIYTNIQMNLDLNDTLILYTDGLVEARDLTGISIGYERFMEIAPSKIRELRRKQRSQSGSGFGKQREIRSLKMMSLW